MKQILFSALLASVFAACRAGENAGSETAKAKYEDQEPIQRYIANGKEVDGFDREIKGGNFEKKFLTLEDAKTFSEVYLKEVPTGKIEIFELESISKSVKKLKESIEGECVGVTGDYIAVCSRNDIYLKCRTLDSARQAAKNHHDKTGHNTGVKKE